MNTMMRITSTVSLCAVLAGCSPVVRTNGNMVEDDRLSQITPGVSRQADVSSILGTPSAEGTFNPNEWYYIGQRTEQIAFFAPEVVDRKVVRVTFDAQTGAVASVDHIAPDSMKDVSPIPRETPTAGHNLTFIEQVLGNVGRFSKKGGASGEE